MFTYNTMLKYYTVFTWNIIFSQPSSLEFQKVQIGSKNIAVKKQVSLIN
jgi:hypothetical protein